MEPQEEVQTELPEVPVMRDRPPAIGLDKQLASPALPRANEAADLQHPHGTTGHPKGRSVLQQHVDFFDENKDGVVTPWETMKGLHRVGFNWLSATAIAIIIHLFISLPTAEPWLGWIPFDPWLRIWIQNIHHGKHGSSSGLFDNEGRFVPQKFEELFSKWDKSGKRALTLNELYKMTHDLSVAMDPFGWIANKFEWGILYWLCADEQGQLSKESIRSAMDGSLFYRLAAGSRQMKQE